MCRTFWHHCLLRLFLLVCWHEHFQSITHVMPCCMHCDCNIWLLGGAFLSRVVGSSQTPTFHSCRGTSMSKKDTQVGVPNVKAWACLGRKLAAKAWGSELDTLRDNTKIWWAKHWVRGWVGFCEKQIWWMVASGGLGVQVLHPKIWLSGAYFPLWRLEWHCHFWRRDKHTRKHPTRRLKQLFLKNCYGRLCTRSSGSQTKQWFDEFFAFIAFTSSLHHLLRQHPFLGGTLRKSRCGWGWSEFSHS